jgi:hypothetical protein
MIRRVTVTTILLIALASGLYLLSTRFISPFDLLGNSTRVVASQTLPNGDEMRIVQYWNEGDFYNLDLKIAGHDGTVCECVIDPDCFRIPSCEIRVDTGKESARIMVRGNTLGIYNWRLRTLTRKNGVQVPCSD